jgi:hypothetical protein
MPYPHHYHATLRPLKFTTSGHTHWIIPQSPGDEELKLCYISECDGQDRRDFRRLFPRLKEYFDSWEIFEDAADTIPQAMR